MTPTATAPGDASVRLFFAIWPDAPARAAVATLVRDVAQRAVGRPTREETLHLTLAFIGDVSPDRVCALEAIGEDASRAAAPFMLTLDILGGFRDARVAWLGVESVPTPLQALAARLSAGLTTDGFRVDRRPFAAHMTLARNCRSVPARTQVTPIAWRVDRVTLVASNLGGGGARYRTQAEWPLAETA